MENGGFRESKQRGEGGGREICWFKCVLFLYYSNEQRASFLEKRKDKFSKEDFSSISEEDRSLKILFAH